MNELRFTEDHEWLRVDGEEVIVGITNYAQDALGELVYVDLPEVGSEVSMGDESGVLESVKAASEVYAPVSGTILAVNELLVDNPQLINESPLDEGWLFRMRMHDPSECGQLLEQSSYQELIGG